MTKLQSAMEYLMTYGWAILVIAVVLGAFYQLGIFGTAPTAFQPSCLASAGFLCQNPALNSSGYLAVKFGQIGISSITVTNLACTSNVTAPSTTNSVNLQLVSGATAILAFSCPLGSNSIGSGFKGYLWLTYSTPTQSGVVDRIAVVTAKVVTSGNVIAVLGGGPSAGGSSSNNFIYCIGGYLYSNNYYAPIYSNGNLGAWTTTNSYPLTVEGPQCVVSGSYIYCEGAYSGSYVATSYSAPIYSTGGIGGWTATTSYPYANAEAPYNGCSTSGGYIYCMGGYDGSSFHQQTYYATISSGTVGSWTA